MSSPHQRATALIQTGFQAQKAGDTAAAETSYRQALALVAEHPSALQLLGLLARQRGAIDVAEDLMRRSLRVLPAQPHVWNNLGNLLDGSGRTEEALACFDRALALDASYADAHYNRARVLHATAHSADAAVALQSALDLVAAPTPAMLQLQSQIAADRGNLPEALVLLDRALDATPDKPALLHNRATLLQRSHRYQEALRMHERAQALGLKSADAHYNHGNTLQSLGRHREAEAAYRQALAVDPNHRLGLFDLSRLRWRLGDADFDAELLAAGQNDPRSAIAPGLRAQLLWRAERYADAAQAFRSALDRAPQSPELLDGLGRCLVRLGDMDAGLRSHQRATALHPTDAQLRVNHAASLLVASRPQEAAVQAQMACDLAPTDQHAWALCGLAWRLLADPREAWLNDYSRFVAVYDLSAPPGWSDMASFTSALAAELAPLHTDIQAPVDQTLRHGTQTLGNLFEQGHLLVNALKGRISAAISDYVARLSEDAAHPFLRRKNAGWHYVGSWSSRLRSGGFHTNHVHPQGWISSAFYVTVPPSLGDGPQRQGWLQFGEPDMHLGLVDPVRMHVRPLGGRLVLFPSMLWHGTTPFHDKTDRVTVAFDVQPTQVG